MQLPSELPILDPRITLLRVNTKRRSFSLRAPQTLGAPPPRILFFTFTEVYRFLVMDRSIWDDPKSWESVEADKRLDPRHVEFVVTFNKDPHCPAKFCYRQNGKFVVPPIGVNWTIINLSRLADGTSPAPESSASLTPTPHQTQVPSRNVDEANSRAMAIVLKQQELQLEQYERSMKHQSTRDWHAERRIKQRPNGPYSNPSKLGKSSAKPHSTKKHDSTGVLNSLKASSRHSFSIDPPSTNTSIPIESYNTSRTGKARESPTVMNSSIAHTHATINTLPTTPSNSVTLPGTPTTTENYVDPWAEFMGLQSPPGTVQEAITITSNLDEVLEVNFAVLEHSIDEFFRTTIEDATPQVPASPRPSTSEVIKDLTFKKTTAAPRTEGADPLFDTDLIPEVEYEDGEGDVDMDAEGSPAPSVVIIS